MANNFNCTWTDYRFQSEKPLVVSITSWKKRIQYLPAAIESIEQQTLKPEKIILWLSSDELSIDEVPESVRNDDNVLICWVDKNIQATKKLLTFKYLQNANVILLDDDFIYDKNVISELVDCANQHDNKGIICYACNPCNLNGEPWGDVYGGKTSYNWVAGCAVMYTPGSFPIEMFDYYDKVMEGEPLHCDECILMPFLYYNQTPIYTVYTNL